MTKKISRYSYSDSYDSYSNSDSYSISSSNSSDIGSRSYTEVKPGRGKKEAYKCISIIIILFSLLSGLILLILFPTNASFLPISS